MDDQEKAFIIAAIRIKLDKEKKAAQKAERPKGRRRRRRR